jgi:hypothetical protein
MDRIAGSGFPLHDHPWTISAGPPPRRQSPYGQPSALHARPQDYPGFPDAPQGTGYDKNRSAP